MKRERKTKTLGSLFAGIGGFDLGFERAGWQTAWQVEINPINRAVLGDRFPAAQRFADVRTCGAKNLPWVDCIAAGFPCQDISNAGNSAGKASRTGLRGKRSGLFFEVLRILDELRPAWVVLENVAALLHSNDCRDLETVIGQLAQRDYLGFARVLDAQFFGVPQRRRRLFLVAGLGRYPALEFLADAGSMAGLPTSLATESEPRPENEFAGYTLSARNAACRIQLGCEVLVAEEGGWDSMVERERITRVRGIPAGLDAYHLAEDYAAGNSICPPIAEWIGEILMRS